MTTNTQETSPVSFKQIDKSVKTLDVDALQQENAAMPANLSGRVQKLASVYGSIKPLLSAVAALPIIPAGWRAALAIFVQTLDFVVASPELVAASGDSDFKAGKDL